MASQTDKPIEFQCIFCGQGITPGELDPCALMLIAGCDRPRRDQKEQCFYCHFACFQGRSEAKNAFYIAEADFPTIGEIESEE